MITTEDIQAIAMIGQPRAIAKIVIATEAFLKLSLVEPRVSSDMDDELINYTACKVVLDMLDKQIPMLTNANNKTFNETYPILAGKYDEH